LPVELISFTGKKQQKEVALEWSTANDYFLIERSANGRDFEPLAQKEGRGTTSQIINYTLMDKEPLSGLNYYRMIQVAYVLILGGFLFRDLRVCEVIAGVPLDLLMSYNYLDLQLN
jgi:hypothetical protein